MIVKMMPMFGLLARRMSMSAMMAKLGFIWLDHDAVTI